MKINERIDGEATTLDEFPDTCPRCHSKIDAVCLEGYSLPDHTAQMMFRCPANSCRTLIVAVYRKRSLTGPGDYNKSKYVFTGHMFPKHFEKREFSTEITKLSERFVSIFNQSAAAESHALDEIAGMGYRKALEILLKDYCIHKNPESGEIVKKTLLGKLIDQHIESENIRKVAKGASWLGNDETHYERRHTNKDISHLKDFLGFVISDIESEIKREDLLRDLCI